MAQINATVGDIEGNAARIIRAIRQAREAGATLLLTPELAVVGYPPKDLVLRRSFIERNVNAVEQIAAECRGITVIVGFCQPDPAGEGKGIFNSAAVCRNGVVETTYAKNLLPTYDVFDESRYFSPGRGVRIINLDDGGKQLRAGLTICEDIWNNRQFEGRRVYGIDPVVETVRAGAQIVLNLSASPYRAGVELERESLFAGEIREQHVPLLYVNQVGGNDDLIFDGASIAIDARGAVIARGRAFEEDLLIVDLAAPDANRIEAQPERIDAIRRALVLGLRDYVYKCGFEKVVLGLSGGIDSALTAALAVEALGSKNVHGVALPSRFSSAHSIEDAAALAKNLRIELVVTPIEDIHRACEASLAPQFSGLPRGVAEENLQARIRGMLVMAFSNKFGWLLLTTGNKSELAVGFCTLYGDMCGGLAVLSDVPKTVVYELARDINRRAGRALIPQRTIDKVPSAELRENQTDQDTIPPYDVLDAILEQYVERDLSPAEIVASGFDRATVERIVFMVDHSEYKRKQAAIGLKVTSRAFGSGRRMPVAAK